MSKIFEEFHSLIHSRPNYRASSWINIDCPCCGDKRKRGGFMPTDTGGFRYFCFNGGCSYNQDASGWEPGNGLNGRTRQLFEMLGGNIRDIPMKEIQRRSSTLYDKHGNVIGKEEKLDVATKFPEVDLPRGTDFLDEIALTNRDAAKALDYLNRRSPMYMEFQDRASFMWSPRHPEHVILPYLHYKETVVGYLGRHIGDVTGKDRFIQRASSDYMYNQHLLSRGSGRYVYVMESPFDAVLMSGVGVRNNRLTQKQINLLKICGRDPVLIPDHNTSEGTAFIDVARENDWYVSVPEWKGKDVGESVRRMGLLTTIEAITSAKTKHYALAKKNLRITSQ